MTQDTTSQATEWSLERTLDQLLPYAQRVWRHRVAFVWFNLVAAALSVLYLTVIWTPSFEADATILPDYGNKGLNLGGFSDLASLAGLNIGDSPTTLIYENLIYSEPVLRSAIYARYQTKKNADSVNLMQYFKMQYRSSVAPSKQERDMFVRFVDRMTRRNLKTSYSRDTRILVLRVTMPESQLAADVANRVVASLDDYLRTQRKSFASNQRYYLDERIGQIKDSLAGAEERLRAFRQQNMTINSPTLVLEQSRLSRNVDLLQSIFVELSRQLELVKVDEIRDTPVLNVREVAQDPILKKGPRRILMLAGLLFLSSVLSTLLYAFERELRGYWNLAKQFTAGVR